MGVLRRREEVVRDESLLYKNDFMGFLILSHHVVVVKVRVKEIAVRSALNGRVQYNAYIIYLLCMLAA